ncbi:MAG TPA: hypothetical protein VFL82_03090 [Thermomicrobiales bacterium]|nr:hypothetical protein [Thermomicrobiales bacterium]
MRAEMWTAVRKEKDIVTFDVRPLDDDPSGTRSVELSLVELADMLREGGLAVTVEKLDRMKLVGTPLPFRRP